MMAEEQTRLTTAGKLLSILLVLGLVATGIYVIGRRGGLGGGGSSSGTATEAPKTEAPDTKGVTTVSEYKYVPVDKLPAVKGVSQYKWDANQKVLRFSYNVWGGWLPVIAANHGATTSSL
jgi:hypothetical protein